MNELPTSIPKQPQLSAAEDYYRLRREGIGFIEQLSSRWWTDYNTHDPGITILEALCYALTDLAYKLNWDIKDLLAPADVPSSNNAYPKQAFFTAQQILTVNPNTPDDFRRVLIDQEGVRNAWVFCKQCACEAPYYAWCEKDQLQLAYQAPVDPQLTAELVYPLGLYDVLLELEDDPSLGDLNDQKLQSHLSLQGTNEPEPIAYTLELHFPEPDLTEVTNYQAFLADLASPTVSLLKFSRNQADTSNSMADAELQRYWSQNFYISLQVQASSYQLTFKNISLRIFAPSKIKDFLQVTELTNQLVDSSTTGFIQTYREKQKLRNQQVNLARQALAQTRNLCEDYCSVKLVAIEDIAVCADIEVTADADIEYVQAKIWFEIEEYLNPSIGFYSPQELLDSGLTVEAIFNGPELKNGFIKNEELAASQLKSFLRTSDLINILMDIEGVQAIHNLLLSKYDALGNIVKGAADPVFNDQGKPRFDANKTSAAWLLAISSLHQPRLHHQVSRFLFYKNGLNFQPRIDEAYDTLLQLRGAAERPKLKQTDLDLLAPVGSKRQTDAYYAVQNTFPPTYGIGSEGLPSHASPLRRAQAKQLKAYLLVFEQILINAQAQLTHLADLFSLDESIKQSYFVQELQDHVQGYTELVSNLADPKLLEMLELPAQFEERRNGFLDHLLARFAEQFGDYAALHVDENNQSLALEKIIQTKLNLLKAYPSISHNRAKAFNTESACALDNYSGLEQRIRLLLGQANLPLLVIEHLLLRPKFIGDALYPACNDGSCETCGAEDPYSFHLTIVMQGWEGTYNTNLEKRHFAEHTIQQEIPAHLVGKICWVSEEQFNRIQTAWCTWLTSSLTVVWSEENLEARLSALLQKHVVPVTKQDLGACARTIISQFGSEFFDWLTTHLNANHPLEQLTDFSPSAIKLCTGLSFAPETTTEIASLLTERYEAYKLPAYHLGELLKQLKLLNNLYPIATLHDCDDGSDQNPVRLGQTALGSNPN